MNPVVAQGRIMRAYVQRTPSAWCQVLLLSFIRTPTLGSPIAKTNVHPAKAQPCPTPGQGKGLRGGTDLGEESPAKQTRSPGGRALWQLARWA